IITFSEKRHKENPAAQYLPPEQIKYMTDIRFFNKRPARDYLAICNNLHNVEIIRNDIEEEDGSNVDQEVVNMLAAKGYDRRELFGVTHYFIAKKTGGPAADPKNIAARPASGVQRLPKGDRFAVIASLLATFGSGSLGG